MFAKIFSTVVIIIVFIVFWYVSIINLPLLQNRNELSLLQNISIIYVNSMTFVGTSFFVILLLDKIWRKEKK